jgi:hypothetical protein
LLLPPLCQAQYSIDWHKISAGGASSGTNGAIVYSVSGAIGQPDAGTAMTGGSYALTGGYWSMIALVQTTGMPALTISRSGASVIVSWPNTATCTLQQNNILTTSAGWATCGYSVSSSNGTNSITFTPPAGNLFFRLAAP